MSDTYIEGSHAADFILSESKRARDNATIKAGSGVLLVGTILAVDGDDFVPAGAADTGVACNLHEVDATGPEAVRVAILARDSEVKIDYLNYKADVAADPALIAAKHADLEAVGIIVR